MSINVTVCLVRFDLTLIAYKQENLLREPNGLLKDVAYCKRKDHRPLKSSIPLNQQ